MINNNYFRDRNISPTSYSDYKIPLHLKRVLPKDKEKLILDFGCGFGQVLQALTNDGYNNVYGYDIEPDAITHCKNSGFTMLDGTQDALETISSKYDFIIISHVLEHIPKQEIIPQLIKLRSMLAAEGELYVAVPNAQSNTGAYWAYEDFTHHTLFTAGSLFFVLKQAGFKKVQFIDPNCLEDCNSQITRIIRRMLIGIYKLNFTFWNLVTNSSFHKPSPIIFSYEVKVLARL